MEITEITKNLYLSGAITNYESLEGKIDIVVNCRSECHDAIDELTKKGIPYYWIPIADWGAPVHDQIETFLNIIRKYPDKRVLVHCAQGKGRSAMLVVVAVLEYFNRNVKTSCGDGYSIADAIKFVKEKRPIVDLTRAQIDKLYVEGALRYWV